MYTDKLRKKCSEHIQHKEEHIVYANNLGLFYKYVNSRLQHRCPIGALIDVSGAVVASDDTKANMFNEYYATAGVVDDGKIPVCHSTVLTRTLETVNFTETSVISVIKTLKAKLSCGPDNLPPILFKRLEYSIARPLSLLFSQLLSVDAVPEDWEKTIITPVFKKGSAGDVTNYTPISLTRVTCKIMERIMLDIFMTI